MDQNTNNQNPTTPEANSQPSTAPAESSTPTTPPPASETPSSTPPSAADQGQPVGDPMASKSTNKILLIIIAVAAVIIVIAVVAFIFIGQSSNSTPTNILPTEEPPTPTIEVSPTPSATDINGVNNLDTGDPTTDVDTLNQEASQLQ